MTEITSETILEVTTERAVAGGRCLARHEGKVLLIAGALPGERVRVRVTRDEKRHAEATVVEVLEPHARRRTPPCPYAAECGGCDFQHAERDLQLEMKRAIVVDAYRRIAHLDVDGLLIGPEPIGDEFGTRNRIRLSFDPLGRPGLVQKGSHEVVAIDDCMLMRPFFGETLVPWLRLTPPWHKAVVRLDDRGQAVILFESGQREKDRKRLGKVTKAMERPQEVVGLLADGIPLGGKRDLVYHVAGKDLRADATSFFQASSPATERLVELVGECLSEKREGTLLDLYAGVGLFAVCLGRGFERVVASEADRRAARHLKHNLKKHVIRGEARAESAAQTLTDVPRADVETVILDPPRIGLAKEVKQQLVARRPRRIVFVSCDPATGARDTRALVEAGWVLESLTAIDLFPVTAHVETVALLQRPQS